MPEKEQPISPIVVGEDTFFPGQSGVVSMTVGALPSGTKISIKAHVYRALKPGPSILLLAGVHGDEINGIEIVRRSIAEETFSRLQRGTVIAIPLLNVYGFINFSRDVPDGKDVNRAFPGTSNGSLAARVAHILHKIILPHVDFGIDFHTGGRGTYNYPQLRYTPEDAQSREIAMAFGAPIVVASTPPARSLRKTALRTYEVPILTYEGGENQRYDGLSLQIGVIGIQRLLVHYGMLPTQYAPTLPIRVRRVEKSTWLRASRAGLFRWYKASGQAVRKGEPLGVICDPRGTLKDKRIIAPRDGFIIGHANAAVVSQGDALFHIGEME
ncbi:MAG: succinylglutamate desuccinylase/aspartoacylase family protein [Bacteroidota bacterium]